MKIPRFLIPIYIRRQPAYFRCGRDIYGYSVDVFLFGVPVFALHYPKE